jgi:hypothetical protein
VRTCPHPAPPRLSLQEYALDKPTLAIITVVVLGVLEGKRYEGYKKTGKVRSRPARAGCALQGLPRGAGRGAAAS